MKTLQMCMYVYPIHSQMEKKRKRIRLLQAFLISILLLFQSGHTYKGAVYEYYPTKANTIEETIEHNLETYRKQIENARDKGVDIIVFPEYGLTTLEVNTEYAIEITPENYVIKKLTNLAAECSMYIVVNLLEKEKEDYYNTNLVFSRNGEIKKKYRKINLSPEERNILTPGNESATFATEFGITFGLLTSSDIFFENPAKDILNNKEVTDVIYTTALRSVMPFFTSLSIQHGYSVGNGVNFLGASYNFPEKGYGGSGIFWEQGNFEQLYISDILNSKLVIQEIKKLVHRRAPECKSVVNQKLHDETDNVPLLGIKIDKKLNLNGCKFENIDITKTDIEKVIHHKKIFCNFTVMVTKPRSINGVYKFAACEDSDVINSSERSFHVCTLLACKTNNNDSCGEIVDYNTAFSLIEITGIFENDDLEMLRPVTLKSSLKPVKTVTYCERNRDNNLEATLRTQNVEKSILVFGIYGIYNKTINESKTKSTNNGNHETNRNHVCKCTSHGYFTSIFLILSIIFNIVSCCIFIFYCYKKNSRICGLQPQNSPEECENLNL